MKTYRIESAADVAKTIDAIGKLDGEIAELDAERKARVDAYKAWCLAHPKDARGRTELFAYRLKDGTRSLARQNGVSKADVIALLKQSESERDTIVEDYDSAELRQRYGGNEANRKAVERYGLYFKDPATVLEVKKI